MKIARKHIITAIENSPFTLTYPKYTIKAIFYRQPGKAGNSGVRVLWQEIKKRKVK